MIKSKWKTSHNLEIAEQLQKQIDEVLATAKDNKYHAVLSQIKKNITTEKRQQLRSRQMTTAVSSTQKPTTNQQSSPFKIVFGRDLI